MASGRACPVARRAAPADDCAPAPGLRPGDQGRGQRGDGERLRPARLHPCRGRRVAGQGRQRHHHRQLQAPHRRQRRQACRQRAGLCQRRAPRSRRQGHPHRARAQGHGELDGRRRAAVRRSAARTLDRPAAGAAARGHRRPGEARARGRPQAAPAARARPPGQDAADPGAGRQPADLYALHLRSARADRRCRPQRQGPAHAHLRRAAQVRSGGRQGHAAAGDRLDRQRDRPGSGAGAFRLRRQGGRAHLP